MAAHYTSNLSIEEIRNYFINNGGTVTNRDAVKYFRPYLTNPLSKDDARDKFKRYVNVLATYRSERDEKFLMLKPQFYDQTYEDFVRVNKSPNYASAQKASPKYDPRNSLGIPSSPHLVGLPLASPTFSGGGSPLRAPPPYRPPPPVPNSPSVSYDNISISSSVLSDVSSTTPQAPPRRKSGDKFRESMAELPAPTSPTLAAPSEDKNKENETPASGCDNKQTVSVKERTQKFNRLASIEDDNSSPKSASKPKKKPQKGADEDDCGTVTSWDPKKCTAWYVAAAKGDYQELAKLASKEPLLVKLKDPFTTVLHWGAKHGNVEIIKLFAGTYKADVNARTNGGYVPLHLAAQFGREETFNILLHVYHANPDIRDYCGKKPQQYLASVDQRKVNASTKIKSRKNKYGDKFLRVGSLNVRVKKTTEAFSSFLGVGGGSIGAIEPIAEKVHKGWGSADNVAQETLMPPPKSYSSKKKNKRAAVEQRTHSNPGTPNQTQRPAIHRHSLQDSDSDSAAGFDSHWQN